MVKYKLLSVYLILSMLFVVTGCNVDENDIIGTWKGELSDRYKEQYVLAKLYVDHTGEMIVYSHDPNFGEKGAVCTFNWSIDGYLINFDGTYVDENACNNDFCTKFRFKDGKLVCEGYLPGGLFNFASNSGCSLIKQ